MKTVALGNSGEKVSVIGLGFWQAGSPLWGTKGKMKPGDVRLILETAMEEGITLLDTAEVYGWGESERLLGEALRELGGHGFFLATKVSGFRWRPGDILKAAQASKRRLGVDAVDLLQHHWPPPAYASLCSVARGLEKSVEEGVARYVGLSNYSSRLLSEILECFRKHEPVSNQVQYSLAYRRPENRLIPLHRERGMATIAWSPLAKGALSSPSPGDRPGRAERAQAGDPVYRRARGDLELHRALETVAESLGATKTQVALAWLVAKGALPIPGTRRAGRVREYAGASRISLSPGQVDLLDRASAKYRGEGDYDSLRGLRLVPGFLQHLLARVMGGF